MGNKHDYPPDLNALREVAAPVSLEDTMAEAGRKILLTDFIKMLRQEDGVRAGEDIEYVHDMRVATRRMRSAFRLLDNYYKNKPVRPHVLGLRKLAKTLGAVRDLDVMIDDFTKMRESMGEDAPHALESLLEKLEKKRRQARKKLIKHLDSGSYQEWVAAFANFLTNPGSGAVAVDENSVTPHQVRHLVPVILHDLLATVRAYDNMLSVTYNPPVIDETVADLEVFSEDGASAPPVEVVLPVAEVDTEMLHALRIEFKRLRYAVSYFADVLGASGEDFVDEIKVVQDHLGRINDIVVAQAHLADLVDDEDDDSGITHYVAQLEQEKQRLITDFRQVWNRFNKRTVQSKLSNALLVLR